MEGIQNVTTIGVKKKKKLKPELKKKEILIQKGNKSPNGKREINVRIEIGKSK